MTNPPLSPAEREMQKHLGIADYLAKGGIVVSRPDRVAFGKAFRSMQAENTVLRKALQKIEKQEHGEGNETARIAREALSHPQR